MIGGAWLRNPPTQLCCKTPMLQARSGLLIRLGFFRFFMGYICKFNAAVVRILGSIVHELLDQGGVWCDKLPWIQLDGMLCCQFYEREQ